ncbi:ZP domain-containing protein [Trichostrongylus colubriformis]|uniref:ZP domain-containing protein n=1 Tax=Trichostrongylus colubriformis TaxID=6319 RepID=A0AAN8FSI6_TRICO
MVPHISFCFESLFRWTCELVDKAKYCMTVHSCTVDDGQGVGQQLMDDRGCSLDSFLLKDLNYGDDLVAGQKAQVFKFADKPTVFFSCIVRLEFKEDSSYKCTVSVSLDCKLHNGQYRKARHSSRHAIDVDVAASSMEVVELLEHGESISIETSHSAT